MLELVAFLVLPEDLPDHGPQHDRVKEEHQAEETQVHDVMDEGACDPASGGRRKGRGLCCVIPRGHELEGSGEAGTCGANPAPSLVTLGAGCVSPTPPCPKLWRSHSWAKESL